MDQNQRALLELLKESLFGQKAELPEDVDWAAVLEEARAQTVAALAAKAVPAERQKLWQEDVLRNQANFVRVLHGQTRLVKTFEEAGVPLVILKGAAAAVYYPDPAGRAMGDVDFLVPRERYENALHLMTEQGYRQFSEGERHAEFMKDGVEFELHRRFSTEGLEVEPALIAGLARAETKNLCGQAFPMLPERENGLVLLAHVCFHLRSGRLGLRQVIDWMMYVHRCLDDEAWENGFREMAAEYGLETLAITMTRMCREWLGLPDSITWDRNADPETALELLETVFARGNFGRKLGEERRVEGVGVNVRMKGGLFRYLQDAGLKHWEAARRYPVLRPFAWGYQLCRWVKLGCRYVLHPSGIRKQLDSGKNLYALQQKLGVF